MPFAAYTALPHRVGKRLKRSRIIAGLAAMLSTLAAAALGWPWLATRLRTLFQAGGHVGGGTNALPVAATVLAVVAVAAAALWSVYRLILVLAGGKKPWWTALLTLAACGGAAVGLLAWGNGALDRAAEANAALLEEDRPALELVLSAAQSPVYSDVLPDLYQREFEGILGSGLPLEDLARKPGCTVLAPADEEYNAFFQMGFRYAQITDRHAIYTGDPSVIEALSAAGYAPAEYYNSVRHMNLKTAAELNQLPFNDEKGVLLEGPERSLTLGQYLDLYGGLYTAIYRLRLPEGASDAPGVVCRLSASCFEGDVPMGEIAVSRELFAADGLLEVPFVFEVGYAPSLQFMAVAEEGRQVWLEDIRYVKERDLTIE